MLFVATVLIGISMEIPLKFPSPPIAMEFDPECAEVVDRHAPSDVLPAPAVPWTVFQETDGVVQVRAFEPQPILPQVPDDVQDSKSKP